MGPDSMWWNGWWMLPFGMPILLMAVHEGRRASPLQH